MKFFLIGFFVFSIALSFGQGLELMPVDEYNKLKSPPQLASSSGSRTAGLPTNYVIPSKFFPTPGNQGNQPSCTAWATGYAFMSFYQACKSNRLVKENKHIYSPSYIYQSIKGSGSCTNGTYISDALNFLKTTGNVTMVDCPYDAKSCYTPSVNLKSIANNYKIKDWFRVEDVKNFNELKAFLTKDIPVIIAAYTDDVFSNFYNKTENDIYFRKQSYDKSGLHAMLLVGYDNSKNAFKVLNSWGTNWGTKGYVWIDYESFRAMIAEGYVVHKDYNLPSINETINPVINDPVVIKDPVVKPIIKKDPILVEYENRIENTIISDELFGIYAYSEDLNDGRKYYTCGFDIDESVLKKVDKVVYIYDDDTFLDNFDVVSEAPYFATAYEGYECYENMLAVVYFKDKTSITFEFDACEFIDYFNNLESEEGEEEYYSNHYTIVPVIRAIESTQRGQYDFRIQLRGIERFKDEVVKVVYDRNNETFKQRYLTTTNKQNNFESGYTGWGCLEELNITIYYTDDTYETYTVNMCEELGW